MSLNHTEPSSASLTSIVILLLFTKANPPITTTLIHPLEEALRIETNLE